MILLVFPILFCSQIVCGHNGATNDEFIIIYDRIQHLKHDSSGKKFVSPASIQRLAVLSNDELPFDDVSSCWKNSMDSNQTDGIKFTEIAQSLGIKHQHRASMAVRPHCVFDISVETFVPNQLNKLGGELCMLEHLTGGVATGDYNNDGLDDLFFTVYNRRSLLYRNNGDGTYTDVTHEAGVGPKLYGNGAGFIDIDQDGDLDLYVTTVGDTRYYLYVNYGGHFEEEAIERNASLQTPTKRKLAGMTPNFGDYDNDGYIDIYTTEWMPKSSGKPSVSRMLRNLGATKPGYFEDTTESAGLNFDSISLAGTFTFGSSFTDFNMDGWPDLLITADFDDSKLFWNNKDGTFTECTSQCGITTTDNGMGHGIGDWNNDGNLDWFTASIYLDPSKCNKVLGCMVDGSSHLYINKGNRTFVDVTNQAGVADGGWAWGAAPIDFNNDGYLDIVHTNGFDVPGSTFEDVFSLEQMRLFENTRNATQPGNVYKMKQVADHYNMNFTGQGRGLLKADIDNDGDEDVIVAANYGPAKIFRNDGGNKANWIKVIVMNKCLGDETKLCESYGALVTVTTPDGRRQLQEIGSSSHFLGQSERTAHFGLGEFTSNIDVQIKWPAKGITLQVQNVISKHVLRIVRPQGSLQINYNDLQQCPMWELDSITKQPDGMLAQINPDRKTVSLSVSPALHLFNIGRKDFEYSLKMVPPQTNETSLPYNTTAVVDLAFQHFMNGGERCHQKYFPDNAHLLTDDRRLDGISNNKEHVNWGSPGNELKRVVHSAYSDGNSKPAAGCGKVKLQQGQCPYPRQYVGYGSERPSPREISNVLFTQRTDVPSSRKMNDLTMHFGQFLSHDLDHTIELSSMFKNSRIGHVWLPIPVPKGDVHFDPTNSGTQFLPFLRSLANRCTGYLPFGDPRQQINLITSFLDGNMVYGTTIERNHELRTFKDGKLKQGADGILPKNKNGFPNTNPIGHKVDYLYIAGDLRANVQPGLMAMHSLFVREHNRLCSAYRRMNPTADDETIFQNARRAVIAEIQSITFNEYLPSLLGGKHHIPPYGQYSSNVNPIVSNIFGTAAFRFGHSQVNSHLFRLDESYKKSKYGHALLRESYFAPERLSEEGGLDPLIRGMMYFPAQEVDVLMVDEMRNVLFSNGAHDGVDLAAMNIQRGRDHGLPDYNAVRRSLGLKVKSNFSEITSNAENAEKLKQLYRTVDNIDLWVGGLAEDHEAGSEMGETFRVILLETFLRVRDGDRFWYENIMTQQEITHIESLTLSKIIKINTGVNDIPFYSFFAMNSCDDVVDFQCIHKKSNKTIDQLIIENRELEMSNEQINQNYHKARQDYMEADNDKNDMRSLSIGFGVFAAFLLVVCLLLAMGLSLKAKKSKTKEKEDLSGRSSQQSSTTIEKVSVGSSNVAFVY